MEYIKKVMNMINKNGKKTLATKAVTRSLQKIKKYIPPSRLDSIFEPVLPSVKIFKRKVAGKVYMIPARITSRRAVFQAANWVYQSLVMENKKKKLSVKLTKLLLETARGKGNVWKLRKQFLLLIKANRSYMRFIRKKKKKRKKWVEKQRFTQRVSVKLARKKKYEARNNLLSRKLRRNSPKFLVSKPVKKKPNRIIHGKDKKINTKNKRQRR